jgi:alkaline phosphatase D
VLLHGDYTLNIDVQGIPSSPNSYTFVFEQVGTPKEAPECSRVGTTRTLHPYTHFRIAHTSCACYPAGHFHVYGEMARMLEVGHLDAWTHVGDFIYEYGNGSPSMWPFASRDGDSNLESNYSPWKEIYSVGEYRLRYRYEVSFARLMYCCTDHQT